MKGGEGRQAVVAILLLLAVLTARAAPSKYKVLGVQQDASHDEIRRAYIKMSKEWHPDKNPSPEATANFQQISDAYATLGNEASRAEYDRMSFLYDLPPMELVKGWKSSLQQLPLYASVVNALSQPPHKGIPEVMNILAGAAGKLVGVLLPGSSRAPWAHAEEALARWLQVQGRPGLDSGTRYVLAGWWAVALLTLAWGAVWPKWPALLLLGNAFMMSYAEKLGVGRAQPEVPEGTSIGGLAVLHTVLVLGMLVGAVWLAARLLQVLWALWSSLGVAAFVGALSTPTTYIIILQASLAVKIIMWSPLIGLPPLLLLMWVPEKRKIPYWLAVYLLRPFAMFGAVLWLLAKCVWNGRPVPWRRHRYITFFAAATLRLLWQLPAWLLNLAARWALFGAIGTFCRMPWHHLTTQGTGTLETEEATTAGFPKGAFGNYRTAGEALWVGFLQYGTVITVLFVTMDVWLNGPPPFLRSAATVAVADVGAAAQDGAAEGEDGSSSDDSSSGQRRGTGGKGEVRYRGRGGSEKQSNKAGKSNRRR